MVTELEARNIALRNMPIGSEIVRVVEYGNLYILQIIWPDPLEGNLDPFFSVNQQTGAFSDFSIQSGGLTLLRQFL